MPTKTKKPKDYSLLPAKEEEDYTAVLPHCGEISIANGHIYGWFHPIPKSTWNDIAAFHRAVSKIGECESVSYHRWSAKDEDYHTLIPYQSTKARGLSVDVDWSDQDNVDLLDKYAQEHGEEFGWPCCCTIHTHVDSHAFESGTDAQDEEDLPGWHLTMGHLVSYKQMDLSARVRLPRLPAVTTLTDTDVSYNIDPAFLFKKNANMRKIESANPKNNPFDIYYERIRLMR